MLHKGFINHEKLVADVRQRMYETGIRQTDIAIELGYETATIHNFLTGRFSGKCGSVRIAEGLIDLFELKESDYNTL